MPAASRSVSPDDVAGGDGPGAVGERGDRVGAADRDQRRRGVFRQQLELPAANARTGDGSLARIVLEVLDGLG